MHADCGGSVYMSIIKDITRGMAPYLVLAGIAGVAWIYRDRILAWLGGAISGAAGGVVQGATHWIQDATRPVADALSAGGETVLEAGDVVRMLTPGLGIGILLGTIRDTFARLVGGTAGNNGSGITTTSSSGAAGIPASPTLQQQVDDISATLRAEYGSSGAYTVRGTSMLGVPLYTPTVERTGSIETETGETYEIWNLGGEYMLKSGDLWLGPNISSCYLRGGVWDYARGRCEGGIV